MYVGFVIVCVCTVKTLWTVTMWENPLTSTVNPLMLEFHFRTILNFKINREFDQNLALALSFSAPLFLYFNPCTVVRKWTRQKIFAARKIN